MQHILGYWRSQYMNTLAKAIISTLLLLYCRYWYERSEPVSAGSHRVLGREQFPPFLTPAGWGGGALYVLTVGGTHACDLL